MSGEMIDLSDKVQKARVLVATPNYTNEFSSECHTSHIECAVDWTRWGMYPLMEEAYKQGLKDGGLAEGKRKGFDFEQQQKMSYNMSIMGRTFVHFARTQLVDVALKGEYSHILWLDDDAVISPSMLPKFINHDKDVMIAPYPMRRPLFEIGVLRSTAFKCNACEWYGYMVWSYEDEKVVVTETLQNYDEDGAIEEDGVIGCPLNDEEVKCPKCKSKDVWRDFHNHKAYRNLSVLHNLDRGVVEVDGGGTHAMLVKMEVFKKKGMEGGPTNMPPEIEEIVQILRDNLDANQVRKYDHYLGDIPDETSNFEEEYHQGKPYFMMPKKGTEDMYWCYRALRKGIKIYCDTDEFAAHIGFPPVITKGFRVQAEKKKLFKSNNGSFSPVDSIELTTIQGEESGGNDKMLPVRKPGIHMDKASNLI